MAIMGGWATGPANGGDFTLRARPVGVFADSKPASQPAVGLGFPERKADIKTPFSPPVAETEGGLQK